MRIPSSVRTVADVIGLDAAVRLMRVAYSPPNGQGSTLYIPSRETPRHRLTTVLQPSEYRAITRAFGGELLSYPSARGMKRKIKAERKAEAIKRDITSGLSTAEITAKHKVSVQYVSRLRVTGRSSSSSRKRNRLNSEKDSHL